MIKRIKTCLVLGVGLLSLFISLALADTASDVYFDQGVQQYLVNDLDAAIKNLEKALSLDQSSEKVKTLLTKILVERGTAFYVRRDYSNASPYLTRAHELRPDNDKITQLYNLLREAVQPKLVISNPNSISVISPGGNSFDLGSVLPIAGAAPKEELVEKLFTSFQKQQEKLLESLMVPQQVLREMIAASDQERRELFQNMSQERNTMVSTLSRKNDLVVTTIQKTKDIMQWAIIYSIAGFVLTIAIVFYLIYRVLIYLNHRHERILFNYQEKMLSMMQEQNLTLLQDQGKLTLNNPHAEEQHGLTGREMIVDVNPHVRAKGIEVIEAELVKNMDIEVAAKLLTPFLQDPDNRVRANAAKALYEFDQEKAFATLQEMVANDNKWMRLSAAWALGEIASSEAINILLQLSADTEFHVRQRVLKSLNALLQKKSESLSADQKQQIKNLLAQEGFPGKEI
ncbi:MAG: HEAT repeat domain-containing protein [Elusimicrobia bacterium]|nr:HEAT repeat domain-containing protein [Elusimicrobiota bacterium]